MNKKRSRPSNNTSRIHKSGPRVADKLVPDGIYCNGTFIHAVASQIGNIAKVETMEGIAFEGIFTTFSSQFEIALELAHQVEPPIEDCLKASNIFDVIIIKAEDIVRITFENVDLEFATRGAEQHRSFQTDSAISRYNGVAAGEKVLQPWDDASSCNGDIDIEDIELEETNVDKIGWDARDMIRTNQINYGIQSSFDDTLIGYTCEIQREDTEDFRATEARAALIAQEIESNTASQARSALENGENEEETYAAVRRNNDDPDAVHSGNHFEDGYKYVYSNKRRNGRGPIRGNGNLSSASSSTNGSHTNVNSNSYNSANSTSKVQSYNNSNHNVPSYSSNTRSHHAPPPSRDREPRMNSQVQENSKYHGGRQLLNIRNSSLRGGRYNTSSENGRSQVNSPNNSSRYHHQSNQHHQQHVSYNSQPARENRSSEKVIPISNCSTLPSAASSVQSTATYAATATNQTRSIPAAVSSSPPLSKPPRVSTTSVHATEYHNKYNAQKIPQHNQRSHSPPPSSHQSQQYVGGGNNNNNNNSNDDNNNSNNNNVGPTAQPQPNSVSANGHPLPQRKANTNQAYNQHTNNSNSRAREDLSDLKKFGAEFNLTSENKTKESTETKYQPPPRGNSSSKSKPTHLDYATVVSAEEPTATSAQTVESSTISPALPSTPPLTPLTAPLPQTMLITHQSATTQTPNVHIQQQQHIQHQAPQLHQQLIQQQHQIQQIHQQHQIQQQLPQQQHQPPPTHVHYQQTPPQQVHVQHAHQIDPNRQQMIVIKHHPQQPQLITQAHLITQQVLQQHPHVQQQYSQQNCSQQHAPNQSPPESPAPSTYVQSPTSPSSTIRSSPELTIKDGGEHENYSTADENQSVTLEKVTHTLKNSNLNPNAKEFVYNPTPKTFTPRSPSTPTHSRPHTPQTPSYTLHQTAAPAGIPSMLVPTGTLVVQSAYIPTAPTSNQTSRLRKVAVTPHRADYHPLNVQVSAAAVTGQPLIPPAATLAQTTLTPGTQFAVQNYSPHHHVAANAQSYHLQMLRGVVPLVPTSISYHHDNTSGATGTTIFMNPSSAAAASNVAIHTPHIHHHHAHQQPQHTPSTASSPSQTPQIPPQTHTPNSYQNATVATQNAPQFVCPVIPAAVPQHTPPTHHMITQAQAAHTVQQYIQHPQVGQQPHHIQVLLPHGNQ